MNSPLTDTGERQSYVAPASTIERAWIAWQMEDGAWRYAGTYDTEQAAKHAVGLEGT